MSETTGSNRVHTPCCGTALLPSAGVTRVSTIGIGHQSAFRVCSRPLSLGGRNGGKARLKAGETLNARVSRRGAFAPSVSAQATRRERRSVSIAAGPRLAPWQEHLAKETMTARIGDTVLISEIAHVCRMSLYHFVRAFANTVGVAPYDWFLGERIHRAKALLEETGNALAMIALECGFADQSHFTNTFVRRVGVTPLQWRRSVWGIRRLPNTVCTK